MEKDLVCNFKKCRKTLTNTAWVTSCSHIFCNDDGTREFQHDLICPAYGPRRTKARYYNGDLYPGSQFLDIPGRKRNIYKRRQPVAQQEIAYLDYAYAKSKDRNQQLEQYYGQVIDRTQTEITNLKNQMSGIQKELEETKKNYNEVSDKLMEKKRQYQKLLSNYDIQRRKCLTPLLDSDHNLTLTPTLHLRRRHSPPLPHHLFQMPLGHRDNNREAFPGNAGEPGRPPHRSSNSSGMRKSSNVAASGSEDFVLRPMKSPADNL